MIHPERIGHVVLKVRDLERSRRFYQDILGLTVMGEVPEFQMVFFSCGGRDHHELAIKAIRADAQAPRPQDVGLLHVAFRLRSEDDLRAAYRELQAHDVPILGSTNHGISKSIYFVDPDGNQIELYCDNPPEEYARMPNPYAGRASLDLG
jgi:catechol 2,3-dioxygenase